MNSGSSTPKTISRVSLWVSGRAAAWRRRERPSACRPYLASASASVCNGFSSSSTIATNATASVAAAAKNTRRNASAASAASCSSAPPSAPGARSPGVDRRRCRPRRSRRTPRPAWCRGGCGRNSWCRPKCRADGAATEFCSAVCDEAGQRPEAQADHDQQHLERHQVEAVHPPRQRRDRRDGEQAGRSSAASCSARWRIERVAREAGADIERDHQHHQA